MRARVQFFKDVFVAFLPLLDIWWGEKRAEREGDELKKTVTL